MDSLDYFDTFAPQFWQTTGLAIICGGIVGTERQLRGKAAGIRTSMLICLSTTVFVQLGSSVEGGNGDPTRVIGQIVTGVGFLGAGVMLAREGVVHGVTTAAVIWMLAAIGATVGVGHYEAALMMSIVTVAILIGVDFLEDRISAMTRGVHARDAGGDRK
jgi:putative Mg2+ transporter-C (MgtC) family protein